MTSTQGMTRTDLLRAIARKVGWDRDPDNWSADETTDAEDALRSGVSRAFQPMPIPGEKAAHVWSFLRIVTTIDITSGVEDYDLPNDFSVMDGSLTIEGSNAGYHSVRLVGESVMRRMRQFSSNAQGYPQLAAVVPKRLTAESHQRWQLQLWPTPSGAYTLRYRYQVSLDVPDEMLPYPYGGPEFAELLRVSCLWAAEEIIEHEPEGPYSQAYQRALMAAVSQDRKRQGSIGCMVEGAEAIEYSRLENYVTVDGVVP